MQPIRFTTRDVFVLAVATTLSLSLWNAPMGIGKGIAFVAFHFMLFCNVVRMRRVYEIAWGVALVWLVYAMAPDFTWLEVAFTMAPCTLLLVLSGSRFTAQRPELHDIRVWRRNRLHEVRVIDSVVFAVACLSIGISHQGHEPVPAILSELYPALLTATVVPLIVLYFSLQLSWKSWIMCLLFIPSTAFNLALITGYLPTIFVTCVLLVSMWVFAPTGRNRFFRRIRMDIGTEVLLLTFLTSQFAPQTIRDHLMLCLFTIAIAMSLVSLLSGHERLKFYELLMRDKSVRKESCEKVPNAHRLPSMIPNIDRELVLFPTHSPGPFREHFAGATIRVPLNIDEGRKALKRDLIYRVGLSLLCVVLGYGITHF